MTVPGRFEDRLWSLKLFAAFTSLPTVHAFTSLPTVHAFTSLPTVHAWFLKQLLQIAPCPGIVFSFWAKSNSESINKAEHSFFWLLLCFVEHSVNPPSSSSNRNTGIHYSTFLSHGYVVCFYLIKEKTAEPIRPKFSLAPCWTLGKVYGL